MFELATPYSVREGRRSVSPSIDFYNNFSPSSSAGAPPGASIGLLKSRQNPSVQALFGEQCSQDPEMFRTFWMFRTFRTCRTMFRTKIAILGFSVTRQTAMPIRTAPRFCLWGCGRFEMLLYGCRDPSRLHVSGPWRVSDTQTV